MSKVFVAVFRFGEIQDFGSDFSVVAV
jgi:hypothetical protein